MRAWIAYKCQRLNKADYRSNVLGDNLVNRPRGGRVGVLIGLRQDRRACSSTKAITCPVHVTDVKLSLGTPSILPLTHILVLSKNCVFLSGGFQWQNISFFLITKTGLLCADVLEHLLLIFKTNNSRSESHTPPSAILHLSPIITMLYKEISQLVSLVTNRK